MAYCRFDEDSDVYMFLTTYDTVYCCGCSLDDIDGTDFIFRRDALRHLKLHKTMGYKVPNYAIDRLISELECMGNEIGDDLITDNLLL